MYASIEIEDDGTPLRRYFLNERDDVLLKIILNCFLTLQEVLKKNGKNHKRIYYGNLQALEDS